MGIPVCVCVSVAHYTEKKKVYMCRKESVSGRDGGMSVPPDAPFPTPSQCSNQKPGTV